jgi:hypothetical protein
VRRTPPATKPAKKTPKARPSIDPNDVAEQQGIKPVKSLAELRGDFWPEDESTEDFLKWLRELRQES